MWRTAFFLLLNVLTGGVVANNWTYVRGQESYTTGVYTGSNAAPGSRFGHGMVTDKDGTLWLFGGVVMITDYYYPQDMNDLWQYMPASNTWKFWKGAAGVPEASVNYVTAMGEYDPINTPGARSYFGMDIDGGDNGSGDIWIYGGCMYPNGGPGYTVFSQVWRFSTVLKQWMFVTLGTADPLYADDGSGRPVNPGSRERVSLAVGPGNKPYIFAGYKTYTKVYSDLWYYNTPGDNWVYVVGPQSINQKGSYGTKRQSSAANYPGARDTFGSLALTPGRSSFYLFGGYGYDSNGNLGYLSDLWSFDFSTQLWTWVSGPAVVNQFGSYGVRNVAGSANKPGGRYGHSFVIDYEYRAWLFGGTGLDYTNSTVGILNDLWTFDLLKSDDNWTWKTGSALKNQFLSNGVVGVTSGTYYPGARSEGSLVAVGKSLVYFAGRIPFVSIYNHYNSIWRYQYDSTHPEGLRTVVNTHVVTQTINPKTVTVMATKMYTPVPATFSRTLMETSTLTPTKATATSVVSMYSTLKPTTVTMSRTSSSSNAQATISSQKISTTSKSSAMATALRTSSIVKSVTITKSQTIVDAATVTDMVLMPKKTVSATVSRSVTAPAPTYPLGSPVVNKIHSTIAADTVTLARTSSRVKTTTATRTAVVTRSAEAVNIVTPMDDVVSETEMNTLTDSEQWDGPVTFINVIYSTIAPDTVILPRTSLQVESVSATLTATLSDKVVVTEGVPGDEETVSKFWTNTIASEPIDETATSLIKIRSTILPNSMTQRPTISLRESISATHTMVLYDIIATTTPIVSIADVLVSVAATDTVTGPRRTKTITDGVMQLSTLSQLQVTLDRTKEHIVDVTSTGVHGVPVTRTEVLSLDVTPTTVDVTVVAENVVTATHQTDDHVARQVVFETLQPEFVTVMENVPPGDDGAVETTDVSNTAYSPSAIVTQSTVTAGAGSSPPSNEESNESDNMWSNFYNSTLPITIGAATSILGIGLGIFFYVRRARRSNRNRRFKQEKNAFNMSSYSEGDTFLVDQFAQATDMMFGARQTVIPSTYMNTQVGTVYQIPEDSFTMDDTGLYTRDTAFRSSTMDDTGLYARDTSSKALFTGSPQEQRKTKPMLPDATFAFPDATFMEPDDIELYYKD